MRKAPGRRGLSLCVSPGMPASAGRPKAKPGLPGGLLLISTVGI